MNYPTPKLVRKCSFRYLYDYMGTAKAYVVTQDKRRKRNVVTGRYKVWKDKSLIELARENGCSIIFRVKQT